ncbi:UDP-glycosyltransferase 79B6-like [Prunus yedoensis var. nudiflora]|uniref:UDP-glycosyltransferase 79B6-like n=1 Tax=Prunus yedoensis var. nudiflora TaxID=2094558 RepID=A0A314UF66_PRUYE|nr:UDP-glycosyltransferase 79B6-like [Prunus yedoensis var. nudiflora]
MGHIIPFLHLSNELAARGHIISFLTPKKAQTLLQHLNLHSHLITFCPMIVPYVEGLHKGLELNSKVPPHLSHLVYIVVDRTTFEPFGLYCRGLHV